MTKPLNVLSDLYSRIASLDQAIAAGGGIVAIEEYTASGISTVPEGATRALIWGMGAGSGGSGGWDSNSTVNPNYAGNGGFPGAAGLVLVTGLSASESKTVTIGTKGLGGNGVQSAGAIGGTTSVAGNPTSFHTHATFGGGDAVIANSTTGDAGDITTDANSVLISTPTFVSPTSGGNYTGSSGNAKGGDGGYLRDHGDGGVGSTTTGGDATGKSAAGGGGGVYNGVAYAGGDGIDGYMLIIYLA